MSLQLAPPSSLRYKPPLSLFSTIAKTRSEFTGETATPMIPKVSVGNPLFFEISFQVLPLSVDFHKAEPSPPLIKLYGVLRECQVEAYKMRGLLGSNVKSTAPASSVAKSTRSQFAPPSVDL